MAISIEIVQSSDTKPLLCMVCIKAIMIHQYYQNVRLHLSQTDFQLYTDVG